MASSTDTDMLEENVPAKTTTVQVKWCGNDYDVVVQSDADVGELKRRVEHDTELPFKRQRHINTQTNDELADNYRVSLLDSPPTTFLIGMYTGIYIGIYTGNSEVLYFHVNLHCKYSYEENSS
ncbi:uncharacterized protein [Triticum aestivum]|uniref:uncharacterized protein isoform X1 n=1 Tax=Triticum aestivum TaxID=4565 RepID=UPI001D012687|nr:uncharacterized protein LOC123062874 isoform X1 [Triticum aestivum]